MPPPSPRRCCAQRRRAAAGAPPGGPRSPAAPPAGRATPAAMGEGHAGHRLLAMWRRRRQKGWRAPAALSLADAFRSRGVRPRVGRWKQLVVGLYRLDLEGCRNHGSAAAARGAAPFDRAGRAPARPATCRQARPCPRRRRGPGKCGCSRPAARHVAREASPRAWGPRARVADAHARRLGAGLSSEANARAGFIPRAPPSLPAHRGPSPAAAPPAAPAARRTRGRAPPRAGGPRALAGPALAGPALAAPRGGLSAIARVRAAAAAGGARGGAPRTRHGARSRRF